MRITGKVWTGDGYQDFELEIPDEQYKEIFGDSLTKHLSIGEPEPPNLLDGRPLTVYKKQKLDRDLVKPPHLCTKDGCYGQRPDCDAPWRGLVEVPVKSWSHPCPDAN